MFRDVVRKKQALSNEECLTLLKDSVRGVLSVITEDGYPYGMPINHFYNEEDGYLYFHGGRFGHKIDSLKACPKASFCVLDEGTPVEEGWWKIFKSVIVFGQVEFVDDKNEVIRICRKLSYQFTNDASYIEDEIAKDADRTLLFRLKPEWITGKRVTEK